MEKINARIYAFNNQYQAPEFEEIDDTELRETRERILDLEDELYALRDAGDDVAKVIAEQADGGLSASIIQSLVIVNTRRVNDRIDQTMRLLSREERKYEMLFNERNAILTCTERIHRTSI